METIAEFEELFGIPWKSTCPPLSPEISRRIDSHDELSEAVESLWRKPAKPEYPDELVSSSQPHSDVPLFGTGGYLVRNNGDRVDLSADTFKGKYVFVCCFHAPSYSGQYLVDLCNELCSTRDDVEVVMVAWMKNLVDANDHKYVFDHFFSGFHKSCLAVPFEDSKRRAYVCKFVHLKYYECLVLDTQGKVLPTYEDMSVLSYGAAAFPFTREILNDFKAKDEQLMTGCSLEQLLLISNYSHDVVYKFNPEGGVREEMSISELSNKVVALYVPGPSGDLFSTLVKIYEQCMKKQLEFEVVVVYSEESPSRSHLSRKLYQEKIDKSVLQESDTCKRWWCLPLSNNSVSLRLSRFIRQYKDNVDSDRVWVVGPGDDGFVGNERRHYSPGQVMIKYGVDAYPFTREGIVQKHVSKMREITLESVLLGDDVFRGTDRDDVVSSDKLLGKKIGLYFGSLHYMWDCEKVFSSYCEMKALDPGFEVVFVYPKSDSDEANVYKTTIYAMPWYVCPVNVARFESFRERFGMSRHFIVGFGEDGHVRSCRKATSATFTRYDTLYEDITERRYLFSRRP